MNKIVSIFLFLLIAGFFSASIGQVNGEYRSLSSGNWNSASTWEQYSTVTGWAPAAAFPNSATAVATIQNGHTVTLSAAAQVKTLNINGIVTTTSLNILTINYLGSITGGGSAAYIDGPLNYQVSTTAGAFKILNLPLGKGSVGRLTSLKVGHNRTNMVTYTIEMMESAPPANTLPAGLGSVSSVRYYSIARTLFPTVTSNINLTLSYDTSDGVGNYNSLLRIVKANAGAWQDLGGVGTAPTTGTILSTTVTQLAATNIFALATANILISGNAGVAGAALTWFDGIDKTTTSAANGTYSIYVPAGWSGTVTPSLLYYNFTPVNLVYTNLIANIANQNFTAATIFRDFRTAGIGDWNDPLIWEGWSDTAWVPSSVPTGKAGSILVRDVDEVYLNVPLNLDSACILTNEGLLHVQNVLTVKANANLINIGTMDNPNIGTEIAPNHPGRLNVYGNYEHRQDGGMLGIAQSFGWTGTYYYTGSRILITGVVYAAPTVPVQSSLSTTIWNCPNQTDDVFLNINGIGGYPSYKDLYVSFGSLTVLNSNSHNIYMFSGQGRTVGDIIVDGPSSRLTAFTRSSNGIEYLFFSYFSNLTVRNGGQFFINTDPGSAVHYTSINIQHNLTVSSNSVFANYGNPAYSGVSYSKIIFTSNYPHVLDLSGQVPAEGVDLNTNNLNMTMSDTVNLMSPIQLQSLALFNGKIISNSNLITILAGGSVTGDLNGNSFTDGQIACQVASTDTTSLIFPVGKGSDGRAIVLNVVQDSAATTTYTAEMKTGAPPVNLLPSSITSVSSARYFTITKSSGASIVQGSIQIPYAANDNVDSLNSALRVVKDDGAGNWVDLGGEGSAPVTGSITSTVNFTSFSNFVLGFAATVPSITANIKVFIGGAYNGAGGMVTTLNADSLIPLNSDSAYSSVVYGYTPGIVSAIPNANIVDWVLLELRNAETTDSSTVVAKKAAFLLNNGLVVDLDGVSPVQFSNMSAGNYYIVVRHRNHLSIMSALPAALNSSSTLYDFTTGESQSYGTGSVYLLGDNIYGMYEGDVNASGIITIADINPVVDVLNATNYTSADVNLSGIVTIADIMKLINNLNKTTNVPN